MEIINDGCGKTPDNGYTKIDQWNDKSTEKLSFHYKNILDLIGEDSNREGLKETPLRVAKAIQFLTQGY
ncbi:unnamed protein product, partial [marine sediment metagenome]